MVQVAILAGGLATRLRPMTETIPKSLIEINGEPFIFHQLRLLRSKGISNVVICTGYLGEMIEAIVANGHAFGMSVTYSYDGNKLLGTGGAIVNALDQLDNEFMITYGDSYLDFDYQGLYNFFHESDCLAVMTVFENKNAFDKSNVVFEEGKLHLYSKKIQDSRMRYIDYGISMVCKSIFDNKQEGNIFDLSVIFEKLSMKRQLAAYEVPERFYEIGSFQGISDLENYLQKNKPIR